jgi:hypothetical protein
MSEIAIYKGKEYPIDENGNIKMDDGVLLNAAEGVKRGKLQIKSASDDMPASSSSSDDLYGYSSSRREKAQPLGIDNTGDPIVDSGRMLLFPLREAAISVGDVLPKGKAKTLVKDYGVPAGAAVDVALNGSTIAGIGAPVKASTTVLGTGIKGVTKFIPNIFRKIAENISNKTLSEMTGITGKSVAEKLTKSVAAKEANLLAEQARLNEAIKFNSKRLKEIIAKGQNATAAEKAEFRKLSQENGVLNRESNRISEKISEAGKEINKNAFVNASDVAQFNPFFPELGAVAGEVGQRAGGIYLGSKFLTDYLRPEEETRFMP